MKKTITILIASALAAVSLYAQEIPQVEGYEVVDSIIYRPSDTFDKDLKGKSIFAVLPKNSGEGRSAVNVTQDRAVRAALENHVTGNAKKTINGYRVRIFFDNKQNSRAESEAALHRFQSSYRGIAAYRIFVSPYFKVTVGDFRTKSEAMELLNMVKRDFPGAFVVNETINYPVVDKDNAFVADTVHLMKPVSTVPQL